MSQAEAACAPAFLDGAAGLVTGSARCAHVSDAHLVSEERIRRSVGTSVSEHRGRSAPNPSTICAPSVGLGFVPSPGQTFTIVNNDGNDAVSGTFASLSEGSVLTTAGGYRFSISYAGGTNTNDVVLTALTVDSTWLASPGTSDFDTPTNWSAAVVPTGTATFDQSNTTTLGFSTSTSLETFRFNAGAPAYTFNFSSLQFLNLTGSGVVNNSSNAPTFNLFNGPGFLEFDNAASAGNAIINNTPGSTTFANSSTAGTAPSRRATTACCRSSIPAPPATRSSPRIPGAAPSSPPTARAATRSSSPTVRSTFLEPRGRATTTSSRPARSRARAPTSWALGSSRSAAMGSRPR